MWVGVIEHPEQVFEKDNLACDDIDRSSVFVLLLVRIAGSLDEFPEDGGVDNVGGDAIEAAGLADGDGVEV